MNDLTLVHLALRAQLMGLSVCSTGTMTLQATATGYSRSGGSFLTDGFAPGMEVTPAGFADNAVGVIESVTALTLTIAGGRAAEAAAGGRSLTVGLPALRAWENVPLPGDGSPVAGRPYIEEEFVPATQTLLSAPAGGGTLEDTGLYVVRWYAAAGVGMTGLSRSASAVVSLFKPGTTFAVAAGMSLRVRGDVGPSRSVIRTDWPGWSVVTVTIPWRLFSVNS